MYKPTNSHWCIPDWADAIATEEDEQTCVVLPPKRTSEKENRKKAADYIKLPTPPIIRMMKQRLNWLRGQKKTASTIHKKNLKNIWPNILILHKYRQPKRSETDSPGKAQDILCEYENNHFQWTFCIVGENRDLRELPGTRCYPCSKRIFLETIAISNTYQRFGMKLGSL